jgi:hypothetical protein
MDEITWTPIPAPCSECGNQVAVGHVPPHSFMAVCTYDPHHQVGTTALAVLDRIRQTKRNDY